MKTGLERIAEKRQKQVESYGYDNEHDQDHMNYELTKAAICYAERATGEGLAIWQDRVPNNWPFEASAWKPEPQVPGHPCPVIQLEDAIEMLTNAGALIAAEIDRIQSRVEPIDAD